MTRTCSIDGCAGRHYARGYCTKHYARWLTHGDPQTSLHDRDHTRGCSTTACGRRHYARGLCQRCYRRYRSRATRGPGYRVLPLFRSGASGRAEVTAKTEQIDALIRLYEGIIAAREARGGMRRSRVPSVPAERSRVASDRERLACYRYLRAVLQWLQDMHAPAVRAMPVMEQIEQFPCPRLEDFGLPANYDPR